MIRYGRVRVLCLALLSGPAWASTGPREVAIDTAAAKASYAFGMDMAASIRGLSEDLGFAVDVDALLKGIEDTLKDEKTLLTKEEARRVKVGLVSERNRRLAALGEKNKAEGERFLAENGKRVGIVTTPSGLEYAVLREGQGKRPRPTDTVKVRYRGTFLDGTEFTNCFASGEPEVRPAGAKLRCFVPPGLAYREKGRGKIGSHATLVYEIELLSVEEHAPILAPSKPHERNPGGEEGAEATVRPSAEASKPRSGGRPRRRP